MCHLYALATVLIWATAYVGTKIVSGSFSPGALGFIRCFSAAVVLMGMAFVFRLRPPKLRDLPLFAASGLSGIALYLIFFNSGIALIGATTSCILIALVPVFTALLAFVFLKEKLAFPGWAAILVSFSGIVLMSLWEGEMTINVGVIWTLIAAALFAVYNLIQRGLSRKYAPRVITAYSFLLAALFLSPLLFRAVPEVGGAPIGHTGIAVLLGVFPSAIAYHLWGKALAVAPKTSVVTNYMFLTPFLSLGLELLILRQWPPAGALLGGAVILGGLALFSVSVGVNARAGAHGD